MRMLKRSLLAAGVGAVVFAGGASGAGGGQKDSGTVYASVVHQAGGFLYAAGWAHDKVLGDVSIVYVVKAAPSSTGTLKITAKKVTLYTSNGSISGTGSATQTVTKTSNTVSDGKVSLTHGAGGQAGHSFVATFSGTFSNGVFTFHYKATYK
jgi:hypothetical protein